MYGLNYKTIDGSDQRKKPENTDDFINRMKSMVQLNSGNGNSEEKKVIPFNNQKHTESFSLESLMGDQGKNTFLKQNETLSDYQKEGFIGLIEGKTTGTYLIQYNEKNYDSRKNEKVIDTKVIKSLDKLYLLVENSNESNNYNNNLLIITLGQAVEKGQNIKIGDQMYSGSKLGEVLMDLAIKRVLNLTNKGMYSNHGSLDCQIFHNALGIAGKTGININPAIKQYEDKTSYKFDIKYNQ